MGVFAGFLKFIQTTMTWPALYGWYHFLWLALMLGGCVLVFCLRKRITPRAVNYILLTMGVTLIVLEILKQLAFGFDFAESGAIISTFRWEFFPFQFCSTPMYLMLLAGIMRRGKVYEALIAYLATFALIGGLVVMIYPGDVFHDYILINFQTMLWHSSMVVIAFMLLCTRSVKFNYRTLLKALIVFVVMLAIALVMNIVVHQFNPDQTFNMFFISPYQPCTLPVLSIIYTLVPWIIIFMIYVFGFTLAAGIVLGLAWLCERLTGRVHTDAKASK